MTRIDYSAPAELFAAKRKNHSRKVGYRRFTSAAEAVRFAVEDMPAILLRGTHLEVNEERFNGNEIVDLYHADDFPLAKAA